MLSRVVITGIGIQLPEVESIEDFILYLNHKEDKNKVHDPKVTYKNRKIKRMLSKGEKYFCCSSMEAVKKSNILDIYVEEVKRGVFLGTTKETSSRKELLEVLQTIYNGILHKQDFPKAVSDNMSPLFVVKSLPNACLHYAAEEFGIRGNNTLFTTNGVASSQAIISSFEAVRRGDCVWTLTGGFDSHSEEGENSNFYQYGLCEKSQNDQKDHLINEGAGALIIEDYDHAVSRGAKIYGEIIGYEEIFLSKDNSFEESNLILKKAIMRSLQRENILQEDISFISIDGSPDNKYSDVEKDVVCTLFPGREIHNIKGEIGNLIAASTVVEVIADLIHPETVVDDNQENKKNTFIKISHGFGGETSILIISRR